MNKLNSTNKSEKLIEFLGKMLVWLRVDLKIKNGKNLTYS